MARLRAGDDDAATEVFYRFADRLVALAQRRLPGPIRRKVDPEDVLQSVFRSFFARQKAGAMADLENWDSLWAMLVVLTLRKCGRRIEYFHAARRDVQREVADTLQASDTNAGSDVRADEPTPSEEAMLTETVERLLSRLEGRHRQILTMALQGFTRVEISEQVGCTERTVYRVLERVKEWLEQMGNSVDAG
jgi:RNA polymerase sigma-70 factor (ECF subfamily)